MFKYIADILAQFSTPQKVIALSLILLSIVIITLGPSIIENKEDLKSEIENKDQKIKLLEKEIGEKDSKIRNEQKSCTDQIVEREKEFIAMLDYLKDKAKKDDNKILSTLNMESLSKVDSSSTTINNKSTIIVKNDMKNIIGEIDIMRKKIKN
jgi:hypothetical protein